MNANDRPHQAALVLLAHVLGKPKTWVLAHPEVHLTPLQSARLDDLLDRLKSGEPLPYLTGQQEFFGLPFRVSPAVLIPRPETELLVEKALDWLRDHPGARRAADVGTGSGCIAVSLVNFCPDLQVTALDISTEALAIARENAQHNHAADRIDFLQGDLLSGTDDRFDVVCANLPYIPTAKLETVNSLTWEPVLALDGGTDGLRLVDKLLMQTLTRLNHPGLILLEIEATTGASALDLARQYYPSAHVALLKDLAGLDRLVRIEVC